MGEYKREIYDILVNYCGALESDWEQFKYHFPVSEWRFQGKLGFGGKLYINDEGKLHVSCYKEDMNPKRMSILTRVNKKLSTLNPPPNTVG